MKTVGHHTCQRRIPIEETIDKAPFMAVHDQIDQTSKEVDFEGMKDIKSQFLGTGFYFWDNNLELANIWGKKHCNDDYCIFSFEIELNSENCFDLVGNRNHQIFLSDEIKKYNIFPKPVDEIPISEIIEILKQYQKLYSEKKIFRYQMARSVDYILPEGYKLIKKPFLGTERIGSDHFTILNPKIAICIFDRSSINLTSKKLIK